MTAKEKKKWLGRYQEYGRELERLQGELARWEALVEQLRRMFEGVAPCEEYLKEKLEGAAAQIVRLQGRLADQATRQAALREQIGELIEGIESHTAREIFRYRYIEGLTWERIAPRLHYSCRQICNLHDRALEQLAL